MSMVLSGQMFQILSELPYYFMWSRSSEIGDRYFIWVSRYDGSQYSYYDTYAYNTHGVALYVYSGRGVCL